MLARPHINYRQNHTLHNHKTHTFYEHKNKSCRPRGHLPNVTHSTGTEVILRRRIPRRSVRPLPHSHLHAVHERPATPTSVLAHRFRDRTRDLGHRKGAYTRGLSRIQTHDLWPPDGIYQPDIRPALPLQHRGREHHQTVCLRHAQAARPLPRHACRHIQRRGTVLYELSAAGAQPVRVSLCGPQVSRHMLGRIHSTIRRRTGQLHRTRRHLHARRATLRL